MMGDLVIDGINGYFDPNINACQPIFALYGVISGGIVDFGLSIITMILFLRPLIRLSKIHHAAHVQKGKGDTSAGTDSEYTTEIEIETSIGDISQTSGSQTSTHGQPTIILKPQLSAQRSIAGFPLSIQVERNSNHIPIQNPFKNKHQHDPVPICTNSPASPSNSLPFRSIAGIPIDQISADIIEEEVSTPVSPSNVVEMPVTFKYNVSNVTQHSSASPPPIPIPSPDRLEEARTDTLRTATMTNTVTNTITRTNTNTMDTLMTLSQTNSVSKKLRKRKRKKRKKRDATLDELITRYALLVNIAILSSVIIHILTPLTSWTTDLGAPIDDAINVWCIILINKANNKVYHKLCCCCNKMITTCV